MTLEQLKNLSDEQLRIEVATLLGWTEFDTKFIGLTAKTIMGSKAVLAGTPPEDKGRADAERGFEPLPDYPNDLNACHEMEKHILTKRREIWYLYHDALAEVTDVCWTKIHVRSEELWLVVSATARQRCEAFVLTLG